MVEIYSKVRHDSFVGSFHHEIHNRDADGDFSESLSQPYGSGGITATGVFFPQWKAYVRQGLNATTSYSAVIDDFDTDWVSITRFTNGLVNPETASPVYWQRMETLDGRIGPSPAVPWPSVVPSSVVTRVTNRCISKFLSSCDSARSSFEAGQDLGEYKETLHSIKRPMSTLQDKTLHYLSLLTKAKKKYARSIPALRKVLSDSYLEWHFGIRPLVDDVAAAVADAGRHRFPVQSVSASASEKFNFSGGTLSWVPPSGIGFAMVLNWPYQSYGTYRVRMKGGIRTGVDPSGRIPFLQAWQLYPENWVPTAWDLLPFSWLVDMFVNVGDIYRGLSFCFSNLTWGAKTIHEEYYRSWRLLTPAPYAYPPGSFAGITQSVDCQGGNGHYNEKRISRSFLSGSDLIPQVSFRIPTSKYAFADIGAVLSQRISRLVPFF